MTIVFKTKDYDLIRRSARGVNYTHAVVFNNITATNSGLGATWHSSLKLAEASAKQINRYAHLELVGIVEVEAQ
jgi:hypothetical protein